MAQQRGPTGPNLLTMLCATVGSSSGWYRVNEDLTPVTSPFPGLNGGGKMVVQEALEYP
jgi:hypothetical protein